ncbi:MAG: VCBS repeat-containing protein, partial [Saprospiraceae bacterium]|nr:VCBS repeat-containing protein [Saprospiraceae bacterium]
MKWILLLSVSIISYNLKAQVPAVFIESSNVLGVSSKNAALAKAIVDMNGDFRDDILTMDKDSVYLEIQMNDGQLFKKVFAHPLEKGPFTINAGDLDNDGLNDFLHAGFYDDINIFHNQGDFDFAKMPATGESIFAQGSSLFDINNDGWLDAVITHDDAASIVLLNDGQGTLVKEDLIDFTTTPASDNSGNYSAIWVDLNQDNLLDMYIAKCRAGVSDPNDPRRINMAFINNDGSFTEMATDMNLDIGEQSWCTDSGDLDNDGDMDMVLINHDAPHMILENKGDGQFEHHINFTDRGPFTTYDLEVAIQDFNNDGWQDILIGGTKDYLLINEGGLQFKRYDNPFGSKNASAFGVG